MTTSPHGYTLAETWRAYLTVCSRMGDARMGELDHQWIQVPYQDIV